MFDGRKTKAAFKQLNQQISGILDTPPIQVTHAPWCIVSMVTSSHVPMYLLALKPFYAKLGKGHVAVIVSKDETQETLDLLSQHVQGIEFVYQEDISTEGCQRGGTWERLLYCIDRSQNEYTIQLDADTLTIGKDIDEVARCVANNTPFTISDGFAIRPLPVVAREAQVPSNYIGIVAEQQFANFPDTESWCYVRGSSGFAGFSKGGFTREKITWFHREMENLLGPDRWKEWGTEQCGSNFAIANSPGAIVLPCPEYVSFGEFAPTQHAKFLHMLGSVRYLDGYYGRKGQHLISELNHTSPSNDGGHEVWPSVRRPLLPALLERFDKPSVARYLFRRSLGATGLTYLKLRNGSAIYIPSIGKSPYGLGRLEDIFLNDQLRPPVWIPRVRVFQIVEIGDHPTLSAMHWLNEYWLSHVTAFADEPDQVHALKTAAEHPNYQKRLTIRSARTAGESTLSLRSVKMDGPGMQASTLQSQADTQVAEIINTFSNRRIDILKVSANRGTFGILMHDRFKELDVSAVVFECNELIHGEAISETRDQLAKLSYRFFYSRPRAAPPLLWAYKLNDNFPEDSLRWN